MIKGAGISGHRLADIARRFAAGALLIEVPELGGLEPAQAAGLAGLAPVARQPGRWSGRAFIRGDRASVRQAAYMPALVATRFNPHMKAQYEQLRMPGSLPGRPHRRHAKADPPGKHSPQGQQTLDPKTRLTKTDTLIRLDDEVAVSLKLQSARPGRVKKAWEPNQPSLVDQGVAARCG